jgi:PAS domain S-box-containing protein
MTNGSTLKKFEEKEWQFRSFFENAIDGMIISDLETGLVVEANPAACIMHDYPRRDFVGSPLMKFIHPGSRDLFNEYIHAFQTDGTFEKRVQHVCRDGSLFYVEWRATVITHQDRPCLFGIVRDVNKRVLAEELLHERVETRTHEQDILLKISHTLASTLEFQPGLILDQLHEIIKYTHGGLFKLEDSTLATLAMRGSTQLEQSVPISIHLQNPEILISLFNGHKPIRIADVWNENPQAKLIRSLLDDGAAALLVGMHSWMWVPLAVRGRIIGFVGVAETGKNYFTSHHADLALSVANQAAITMINAELYKQAQALAVLEERQRLARNLHDAVNQSLFSAGLIAEVLPRLWERDQAEALRSLEDLRRLTRGAQAEMRALLAELRPSTITDSNLVDLLRLLGNALSGRTSIPVTITASGEFVLPGEVQITFYRICQEALNNVAKHARASHVDINLIHEGNDIELRIHDDGQGFDPQRTISGHYGLGMMRERAEDVGAIFSVTSKPDQGTEITICWNNSISKEAS